MDNVFSYKGNYFLIIDGTTIPAPIPGDIVIKKEEYVRLALSSELYTDGLRLTLLAEKSWVPGRGGSKVWVPEVKDVDITKDNISDFIIKRGSKQIYPIPVPQKIINFFINMIFKIKLKFSKEQK